jgi:2-C-methyl-D-erythritol 2,4-cyclodiphosphate synthase
MSSLNIRIGEGWDVHALVEGRPLIIGGVSIPFKKGLLGHSDADVLIHALIDALLGAAGMGDIGKHFPDTDPRYKGANSQVMLKAAYALVAKAGWSIVNIDSTIIAQAPKMAPFISQMIECLSACLNISADRINIKAKTAEKLGPVGLGQSIEARAVVLLGGVSTN